MEEIKLNPLLESTGLSSAKINRMEGRALKPIQLTGNVGENWRQWKQKFEIYSAAIELKAKSEETQCAQLLFQMGEEAIDIFNTFTFMDDEKNKIAKLIEKFDNYFSLRRNVTYERYKFFTARQNDRTIEEFLLALEDQAQACHFPDRKFKSELIKTMLIVGLKDQNVREHLLGKEYTLENAIEVCNLLSTQSLQNDLNPTNQNVSDDDNNNIQKSKGKQHEKELNIGKGEIDLYGDDVELQNAVRKQIEQEIQDKNAELELLEKNRSNATFRFNVPILEIINLKDKGWIRQLSTTCVRNLPWIIQIQKCGDFLGVFLFCKGEMETESSWSCAAVTEFRLLPMRLGAKIISHSHDQCVFKFQGQAWGLQNFVRLNDVLDGEKGYIENDSLTFEVYLYTEVPKEVPKEKTQN